MSLNSNPLISIITVVYNGENTIEGTIKSVESQSYKNKEYIIIDGFSTDDTLNIITKYKESINFLLSEKDLGIYYAMNKGLLHVNGDLIIFLNSGDLFSNSDVLTDIVLKYRDVSFDILYGNTLHLNTLNYIQKELNINKYYFFSNTICHQSCVFTKNSIILNGFFNTKYKILADREWLLRGFINNLKIVYCNIDISIWDDIGFSSNNIKLYIQEQKVFQYKYYNYFEKYWAMIYNKIYKLIRY